MSNVTFRGLRGTGDWATDERPKNYRQGILKENPNGDTLLTGLMSKMGNESTDDPEYNWWTQNLPTQRGAVTGVYTDLALSSAYASGAVVDTVLYFKMSADDAKEFREGHIVRAVVSAKVFADAVGKVVGVGINGASSYVAMKFLEADDNGGGVFLANGTCDAMMVAGNANPEGGGIPTSIKTNPTKFYNYTQIFRTPLEITRTAQKTKLRTREAYLDAKAECLQMHGIEMEKASWFGIKSEKTGANGQPERTTEGIIQFLRNNAAANVVSYKYDAAYSTQTWAAGGENWLEEQLERLFRFGSDERLAVCGSLALQAINKLAKLGGHINLAPRDSVYGLRVVEWVTPYGVIYLKRHPLFSYEATMQRGIVFIEPGNLKYRYITDTMYKKDPGQEQGGTIGFDGKKEEFLTEAGYEFHFPLRMMYLQELGVTNIA